MREFTKYHDTSKSVKERAKTKVFGAVYSHTAIILLLILLQIGIMVLTFTYLGNYSTYMNGVMSLLSFITAIYILFADEIFRWNLSLQIRNADQAEPSDLEIAGRYIGSL